MICRECNADIPDGSEFCPVCGKSAVGEVTADEPAIICKKCGAAIPSSSAFCLECGQPVADEKILAHEYQKKKFASVRQIINERIIAIGEEAFADCYKLEEVNLPNSIKTLEKRAFANCTALTSLRLPESISVINESVFSGCVRLKEVVIPEGVEIIKAEAFSGCIGLVGVKFPKSLLYIENEAFSGCTSLEGIYIPDNVKEIKSGAFKNCGNPLTVFISKEVDYADDTFDKTVVPLYERDEDKLRQIIEEHKLAKAARIAAAKKTEMERVAAEKAKTEKIAAEKADAKRIADEEKRAEAEEERITLEKRKAEEERIRAEKERVEKAKENGIMIAGIVSLLIIIALFATGHPWFAAAGIIAVLAGYEYITEHPVYGTLIVGGGLIIILVLKVATGIIGTIASWFS
jgi:RNA polymerase subunit RPABC4/transcription elongation factor Spt4